MLKQVDDKLKKKKEYHNDTINEEISVFKIEDYSRIFL